MRSRLVSSCLLAALAALALVAVRPAAAAAQAQACGLPEPTWYVEFSDGSVQFRNEIFRRPGLILATQGTALPSSLRAGGAWTIGWENDLSIYVGTNTKPADPATLNDAENTILQRAAGTNAPGCATPLIAFNELLDPTAPGPWSAAEAQYRQNVLTLFQALSARGVTAFLLVPHTPGVVAGPAAFWWQQVSTVAQI